MKLITEEIEQCKILVEEKDAKKSMYIEVFSYKET